MTERPYGRSMNVFVYGTLTNPTRVARVVSEFEFGEDAVLDGLHRVEGEYPTLAPGGSVSGRILRASAVESLDAYEGVESGLYVRVSVPQADFDSVEPRPDTVELRSDTVELYVGDPDALGAEAAWPGEGSFPERVRRFVREREVVVRPKRPEP